MRRRTLGAALGAQPGVRPRGFRGRHARPRRDQRAPSGPDPDRAEQRGAGRAPPLLPPARRRVRQVPGRRVGPRRRRGRRRAATGSLPGGGLRRPRPARGRLRRARRASRARTGPPGRDGVPAPRRSGFRRRTAAGTRRTHRRGPRRGGARPRRWPGRPAAIVELAARRDPRPRPRARRRRPVRHPGARRPRGRRDQGQHAVGPVLALDPHRLHLQPGQAQHRRQPQGRRGSNCCAALVRTVDVVQHNMRYEAAIRLGLDADESCGRSTLA